MQKLNPLTLVPVSAASRNIFHMPRIDDAGLKTAAVEDVEQRNPVYAGRLHGHRGDAAAFQPIRHPLDIFRESAEAADRLVVGIIVDGNKNLPSPDVDSCRTRLFDGPVIQAQSLVSLFGHADLSFRSAAAKPRCDKVLF